ncbi:GAF domain-containing protein [Subtercola endophyticus]|uniref:GAF domain-containing protein n=1 Tax=Subtercola endophyticus TaxID=2895559 RepID=UPI001E34AD12|nr:GAF domain-containing protein [Subtercola endophyticus]UFS60522.1 GAF domain-containing protein [Subtercola endophyticus]
MTLMASLAEELAGEFRLQPLLEKILTNAVRLLGCRSGSICTIDHAAATYRKEVDLDVHCQAGHVFQLDEGVTGAVVRAGAFVSFASYASVPRGHISRDDERFGSPVIGVPITVNDGMIGAFVVFGEPGHPFTEADAELLELFATHAAVAIVNSKMHTADLDRAVAKALGTAPAGALPVRLTAREKQVRNLVVKGLPDKQIATLLAISAKTVEKHVGSILHKCGVPNRTALASMARAEGDERYGGNPA